MLDDRRLVAAVACNLCATSFDAAEQRLLVKDGHPIVRCPSCGLVSRETLPTAAEVDDLYGSDYFAAAHGELGHEGYLDYVGDAEAHRANARRRLERLARFGSPGPLLDVGCAAGFFVDEARRAGWDARGIDVSAEMVDWGVRELGANLAVGTLADERGSGTESCISMWDYVEHALDPRGDVERAYGLLRPGGLLALSTGDVGSALARVSLERWHLLTPRHHNYYFSADTMHRLLRSCGYDVVYLGHPGAVFPLRYLAHKAGLVLDVSPVHALARRIDRSRRGSWTLPVNLFDVLTVIARRPA
jgi:SAM-dependent methyltransferase